nr:glycosyltransferase family 2 protein [Candidatus Bipolaricaulota bacterium]
MDTEIKTKEDVAVLITAYNEAKILGCLLENIPSTYHVYVVDDGSTDETSRIASKHRAEVVALPINIGQGAASVAGYKLLAEMDYDYLVKMDGDGQHDPGEIPKMIRKLEESNADIVVGSRVLGSTHNEAPLLRRLFLSPVTKLFP